MKQSKDHFCIFVSIASISLIEVFSVILDVSERLKGGREHLFIERLAQQQSIHVFLHLFRKTILFFKGMKYLTITFDKGTLDTF